MPEEVECVDAMNATDHSEGARQYLYSLYPMYATHDRASAFRQTHRRAIRESAAPTIRCFAARTPPLLRQAASGGPGQAGIATCPWPDGCEGPGIVFARPRWRGARPREGAVRPLPAAQAFEGGKPVCTLRLARAAPAARVIGCRAPIGRSDFVLTAVAGDHAAIPFRQQWHSDKFSCRSDNKTPALRASAGSRGPGFGAGFGVRA